MWGPHLSVTLGRQRCIHRGPTALNEEGQVLCRVHITISPEESCDEVRGRLDPLDARGERTPRLEIEGDRTLRVCEIRQLTGTALEACRTDLACTGCRPGWCLREPWGEDDYEVHDCVDAGDVSWRQFRFVLGSDVHPAGFVSAVCQ